MPSTHSFQTETSPKSSPSATPASNSSNPTPPPSSKPKAKAENPFINLGFNILLPALLLSKGHAWFGWEPTHTLLIALAFPFCYGVFDFLKDKRINPISVLGLVSIFLTGIIGILSLPKEWIALKEAFVPLVIGLVVVLSMKTRYPLIKTLLYNDKVLDIQRIENILATNGHAASADKLLTRCTYYIASSFILSAGLNFSLAKYFIKSETGTHAFTEELGKMTAWSYPMIVLPCTLVLFFALWQLLSGLKKLTGLDIEEMLHNAPPKDTAKK